MSTASCYGPFIRTRCGAASVGRLCQETKATGSATDDSPNLGALLKIFPFVALNLVVLAILKER